MRQGLPLAEAQWHAMRLAHVFRSAEDAALAGLPATFDWCRGQGLSVLETAQLLDHMESSSHESVRSFSSGAQLVWQRFDAAIAAHVERQRRSGGRLPKRTYLAEVLHSRKTATVALTKLPGRVAEWLAVVGQHLALADICAVLLNNPLIVHCRPATAAATLAWAADELQLEGDELAAFNRKARLLGSDPITLQANLDNVQRAAGLTPEQTQRLVCASPRLLTSSQGVVNAVAAWLQRLYPSPEARWDVLRRAPQLLFCRHHASSVRLGGERGGRAAGGLHRGAPAGLRQRQVGQPRGRAQAAVPDKRGGRDRAAVRAGPRLPDGFARARDRRLRACAGACWGQQLGPDWSDAAGQQQPHPAFCSPPLPQEHAPQLLRGRAVECRSPGSAIKHTCSGTASVPPHVRPTCGRGRRARRGGACWRTCGAGGVGGSLQAQQTVWPWLDAEPSHMLPPLQGRQGRRGVAARRAGPEIGRAHV